MAKNYQIPLWKIAPFVRLLLPLILGILIQNFVGFTFQTLCILISVFLFAHLVFNYLPISFRYQYQWLHGLCIKGIIIFFAALLYLQKDVRNNKQWYGKNYTDSSTVIIKIIEPLIEKEKSYKTIGEVITILNQSKKINARGKVLLYFAKNDSNINISYGNIIAIQGSLQKIKNGGNPGGFNYSRYMVFQQTTHQAYIKNDGYALLGTISKNVFYKSIFTTKATIINILQKYIVGSKKVTGIAEALLIGYKEDLDKDVVQAYSNTGVVHIIAISGMHLGLIYIGLVWLMARIPFIKKSAIARVVVILSCLWLFSLLTGASASVLRSAVMFTCIVIGKEFFKQASVYNSLATSAFLLLCYNPFLLWDVGFQLSYCAIIGIVWLQKPIQNLYYSKHIALQYIWQMCSITFAAQILTMPICIYYFHQIPTTFLFTNLVCVPISSLILFAEIGLIICAIYAPLATILGNFTYVLTWSMNWVINFFNRLPFSLVDSIYATTATTFALYNFVFLLAAALLRKNKRLFKIAVASFTVYVALFVYGKINLAQQKKIIIYNVSKHTAIDFMAKNKYYFWGDTAFNYEGALQNFNLKPSRILYQVEKSKTSLPSIKNASGLCQFYDRKMLILSTNTTLKPLQNKILVDIVLITKSPNINLLDITEAVRPAIIVFDGSNSLWKIKQWKKQCEDLHLQYFDTNEQGAFILNVQ